MNVNANNGFVINKFRNTVFSGSFDSSQWNCVISIQTERKEVQFLEMSRFYLIFYFCALAT